MKLFSNTTLGVYIIFSHLMPPCRLSMSLYSNVCEDLNLVIWTWFWLHVWHTRKLLGLINPYHHPSWGCKLHINTHSCNQWKWYSCTSIWTAFVFTIHNSLCHTAVHVESPCHIINYHYWRWIKSVDSYSTPHCYLCMCMDGLRMINPLIPTG